MSPIEQEKEFLDLQRTRAVIYDFLSKVYEKEVTLEFLKDYSSEASPLLRMVGIGDFGNDELNEGFDELIRYFKGLRGEDLNKAKLELDVEYVDLFILGGKPPHPSESVYSIYGKYVMGKPRMDVLRAYKNAGVGKVKEYTEPEDHIAIELQFMAYLCQKTIEASEKGKKDEVQKWVEMQKDFVNEHLSVWVPKLTRDILETSQIDFYRGVAKITEGFIKIEVLGLGPIEGPATAKE